MRAFFFRQRRTGKEVRRALKGQVFETVEQVEAALTDCLNRYWQQHDTLISLTFWDWMMLKP
jgi:hypothetical protein